LYKHCLRYQSPGTSALRLVSYLKAGLKDKVRYEHASEALSFITLAKKGGIIPDNRLFIVPSGASVEYVGVSKKKEGE